MAAIQSYPLGTPKSSDLVVGTSIPLPDTNDTPITKSFSVGSIGSNIITDNNVITGTGTINTIPMFTLDGTTVGNSSITQDVSGNVTTGFNLTVTDDLLVGGDFEVTNSSEFGGALTVEGVSTFNDDIEVNNNATFYSTSTFEDTAEFQQAVKDSSSSTGTSGQVLSSTGTETLWSSINALSEIKTAQATITDAQIRTLGTLPVEILPAVTGYIYEILSATTQSIDSGGVGDSYDWGGQSGVISSRENLFTGLHKVEIPNAQLPSGGGGVSDSVYVATPVAGTSRTGGSIKVTVTDNINPTIPIAQAPSAQLLINITYKLIQVQ